MHPIISVLIFYIYLVVVLLVLLNDDRDPGSTMAWIIFLIVVPGIGLIFYFLVGRNWRRITQKKNKFPELKKEINDVMSEIYNQNHKQINWLAEKYKNNYIEKIISIIKKDNGHLPLPADDLLILPSGAEKFSHLKEDLKKAKKFVHMQYFIWENDVLTKDIIEILKQKKREGVEVRIMYDFIGSLLYSKKDLRFLKAIGAEIYPDVTSLQKLNYRNHRKIVIIDGNIGYTGGMNMGQEYIDGGKKYKTWRDTHLRIEGQFIAELQEVFAERWYKITKKSIFERKYFPIIKQKDNLENPLMLQLVNSSADDPREAIEQTYLVAINNAQKTIYIQSPYFVPSMPLYKAMITASLSGVDVRFMMTGVPDRKIVYWTAFSYFGKLLDAGVKIYHYQPGFFHAKTWTIDSEIASIGTTNFDNRSFNLHHELSVIIYNSEKTKKQNEIFFDDIKKCEQLTIKKYKAISPMAKFRNSLARLGSDLF